MSDQVKIGGDARELIAAIDAAEARFAQFESTVAQTASGGFERIGRQIKDSSVPAASRLALEGRKVAVNWKDVAEQTKRAGAELTALDRRRTRNTAASRGGTLPPARPGQYDSPAEEEESSAGRRGRGGLSNGLGRYIGAGFLIGELHQLANAMVDAGIKSIELQTRIRGITGAGGNSEFSKSSAIERKIDETSGALSEIYERRASEGSGALGTAQKFIRQRGVQIAGGGSPEEQDAAEEADRVRLQQKASELLGQLAQKQTRLNAVEATRRTGSERQADLDAEEIRHHERLGELAELEARTGVQNGAAIEAEKDRTAQANAAIASKHDLLEAELQLRRDILSVTSSSATGDQKSLATLRARMDAANTRAVGGLTATDRAKAGQDAAEAEHSVKQEQYRQYQLNTGEGGAEYRQGQREEQTRRQNFEAQAADYENRRSRGAYGQSSFTADLFGRSERPSTGPGAGNALHEAKTRHWALDDPRTSSVKSGSQTGENEWRELFPKIETLITTLNALPGKIGVV